MIKKFENFEEDKKLQPKVKHLIEYLSSLDPEMEVGLEHDGWYTHESLISINNEVELIEKRGIFDIFTYDGKTVMTINN